MAGIRYDQLNLIKRAGMKLKIFGSRRMEGILTLRGLTTWGSDIKYNSTQRVIHVLR